MKALQRALGAVLALSLVALIGFLVYKAATSSDVVTAFRNAMQSESAGGDASAAQSPWQRTAGDPLALYALLLLAAFAGALVIVSAIQIFFLIRADLTSRLAAQAAQAAAEATAGLLVAASRQEADLAQQIAIARSAADAARAAADAARGATEVSRLALRPFVFVSRLELADVENATPDPHFRLKLTNHGQTPALINAVGWQFEILDPAAGRRYGGGPGRIILSSTLSAREETADIPIRPSRTDLSALIVRKVKSDELLLRIWLRISYADVFGQWHEEFPDYRYYDGTPGVQFVRTTDVAGGEGAERHPLTDGGHPSDPDQSQDGTGRP